MHTVLIAERLLTPREVIDHPAVFIEDGFIQQIAPRAGIEIPTAADVLDYAGHTLVPAFLDVHTHGAAGHDIMEATSEAMAAVGRFLAGHGVGSYLATTVTAPIDATLRALDGLADSIETPTNEEATPVGIHLEGPFVSHAKRGVHPPASIREPSITLFDQLWQAARGHIRLITIAPELPNALEVIEHATRLGVRVSLGHSDATAQEALAGIAAGAVSATHTFNAMRALDHREPGILGVALDRDDLYAELICDGIHVAPELVRLWLKSKGGARAMLVTDSISATGMPDGAYMLGDLSVKVANGRATCDGALAGSVLTMDRALRNLIDFTRAGLQTASRLASTNAAAMLGLESTHGLIAAGRRANIAVLAPDGALVATLLNGRTRR